MYKDQLYGDFEDLETGEVHVGKPEEPNADEVCSDPSHLTCSFMVMTECQFGK